MSVEVEQSGSRERYVGEGGVGLWLVGSVGGDGVVVRLMGLSGVDSDAEDACAVPLPDWLRVLRVFSAILSDGDEGMFDLFVKGDGRPDEAEGRLQTVFLLLFMKLRDFLHDGDDHVAYSLRAYE